MQTLNFSERKKIRAAVISRYIKTAGYPGVVIFTCGNAATALRAAGIDVLEVSPGGDLRPGKWWSVAEIHKAWPHLFDATCGHLPAPLMIQLAQAYSEHLGFLQGGYQVPTGSGETITCLRWAYPNTSFLPLYGSTESTKYSKHAPLNLAVNACTGARSITSFSAHGMQKVKSAQMAVVEGKQ